MCTVWGAKAEGVKGAEGEEVIVVSRPSFKTVLAPVKPPLVQCVLGEVEDTL